jgi:hypothetical protein
MGRQRSFAIVALAIGLSAPLGCSGPRIKAPKFDPAEAARQAMSEFDADKDGGLDADELAKCPGLLAAKASIPPNADGRLTESAIAARLKGYQTREQVVKAFSCQVLLDEQPLADATISLVPEKFLGPTFQGADGATSQGGTAVVSAAEVRAKGFSGVYCGLYRVQISSRDAAGKERLPAKYNTETTLGLEVAPEGEPGRGCVFRLSRSLSGR